MPPSSSAKAQAMIVSSWRRWSKTSSSVGDHQRHVGQPERVGVGLAERLDRADQVVAEEADGAAGERRQALDRGGPVAGRGCSATAA